MKTHPSKRPARGQQKKQRQIRSSRTQGSSELRALRALGQNFLIDDEVLDAMEECVRAGLAEGRKPPLPALCEVGPGMAALTHRLLKIGPVVCIEKDQRAVDWLQQSPTLISPAFAVVQGDILRWNPEKVAQLACEHLHHARPAAPLPPTQSTYLVGNLPYNISSDFLLWFCQGKGHFAGGHFLLQREVVDRITAKPGSRDYGRLTAQLQLHYVAKKLFDVPPTAFKPAPQVFSSFVQLSPLPFSFTSPEERLFFEKVTAAFFSQRRKMLRSSVAHLLATLDLPYAVAEQKIFDLLGHHSVVPSDRPEKISPAAFLELSRQLLALSRNPG